MKKSIFLFLFMAMFFAACQTSQPKPEEQATTDTTQAEAQPAETPAANVTEVVLNAGDDMKYDKTEIKVKEGATVKVTLNHTGKSPLAAMGHNFVLLKQGVDMEKFATAAIKAQDNDYIPPSMTGDVIAHTTIIGGGETTDVEFAAPPKGTYDFLCSFPGHHATMKGKFIVE